MTSNSKLSNADLRALLADITPGEWEGRAPHPNTDAVWIESPSQGPQVVALVEQHDGMDEVQKDANASAIAQVPALLAEVLALREALSDLTASVQKWAPQIDRSRARAALKGAE